MLSRGKNAEGEGKERPFWRLGEKMEAALLEGESSRSSSGPRRRDDRTGAFLRRSDAIAYGSPYQKAAALVDLVCFPPFFSTV